MDIPSGIIPEKVLEDSQQDSFFYQGFIGGK